MDFSLPPHLASLLAELEAFIEAGMAPLEAGHAADFATPPPPAASLAPRRARRLHRGGDRPARGRAPRVLRPPSRERPDRLGEGRAPPRGVGGAARREPPPARRRGVPPLRAPAGDRRPRRREPRHGGDPRAPRPPRPRPPQRPAER